MNRQLLLKAKYKLSDADLLGYKPDQSFSTEQLFAQRLRDKGVPEPFVLEAIKTVPAHLMTKVLSGEEPLNIKKIDEASYEEEKFNKKAKKRKQHSSIDESVRVYKELYKEGKKNDFQLHISPDYSSISFKDFSSDDNDSASDYINKNLSNFKIRQARQRSQRVKERKFRAGARAFIQVDGDLTSSQEEQLQALTALVRSILKVKK